MILFLNVNDNMIELYNEEGIVKIPFQKVCQLYDYVEENSSILYITNAVKIVPIEVVNMIKNMGIAILDNIPIDTGMKYLYSSSVGTIYINEFLKFDGEFDMKLIDEEMAQIIQGNRLLQQLIKNKKIEVIGEMKRRQIMSEYKSNQEKKLSKQKEIDAGSDSMIVKTSVEQRIKNKTSNDAHSEAEEISILSGGPIADTGGMSTMSELMNEIEGI